MTLYRIDRSLGDITDEEFDAQAYRAVQLLKSFPELSWVRSFFDPVARRTMCFYECDPKDMDRIRAHAAAAGISCEAITEVIELLADDYR